MRTGHVICVCVGLVAAACSLSCTASYPTAPLDPNPLAFQVFHAQAHPPANIGATYTFVAFAYRADGAYENVTASAAWSSSDPSVARLTAAGQFVAVAEGNATIHAQYRGAASSLSMSVVRQPYPFPYLFFLGTADPRAVGANGTSFLTLNEGRLSQTVTALAIWVSSNPRVATVDRGVVTGVGPGSTQISATYNGLAAWYDLSILPPAR